MALTARPGYNATDDTLVTAVELHALNGVPVPDTPAGESDSWHGIVDTTHIRQELGSAPTIRRSVQLMQRGPDP